MGIKERYNVYRYDRKTKEISHVVSQDYPLALDNFKDGDWLIENHPYAGLCYYRINTAKKGEHPFRAYGEKNLPRKLKALLLLLGH